MYSERPFEHFTDHRHNRAHDLRENKYCYVCGKVWCWSTKYSMAFRMASFRKEKAISQVVTEIEDSEMESDG